MSSPAPVADGLLPADIAQALQFTPTPEQTDALNQLEAFIKNPKADAISFSGLAGSGKTTTLRELSLRLPNLASTSTRDGALHGKTAPASLGWSAMTGKAAQRLASVTGKYALTLHSTLYEAPEVDHNHLAFTDLQEPSCKILIIDEASMVTPKIYEDLRSWMKQGVKVVFVGDFFQLPPILDKKEEEKYGQDFSIFQKVQGPRLTRVMRATNEIVTVAAHIREKQVLPRQSQGAYTCKIAKDVIQAAVDDYLDDPDDHVLITWRNEARMDANKRIRDRRGLTSIVMGNEPVLICKNGQGLLNGEIRKVLFAGPGPVVGPVKTFYMKFEGLDKDGQPRQVLVTLGGKTAMDGATPFIANPKDWGTYRRELQQQKLPEPIPVTYGYARTCHKVQGDEARRVTVFLTRAELVNPAFLRPTILPTGERVPFGCRWLYTAVTRAKEQVTVVLDQ